jgi:hypothetical protein
MVFGRIFSRCPGDEAAFRRQRLIRPHWYLHYHNEALRERVRAHVGPCSERLDRTAEPERKPELRRMAMPAASVGQRGW